MTARANLPRVTYANVTADFTPVHALLDEMIPHFKANELGRHWANHVAGRADDDGHVYKAVSPIDRTVTLGTFVEASAGAVSRAVAAARGSFPAWSRAPWRDRVRLLRRVAEILDERKFELAIACLIEVGKSRLEAMGEAEEAVDLIRYYCDEMERHEGFVRPMARAFEREETKDVLRPLGVFGVIAPFNFPLALSIGMMTGALVTGNTVVYKPSPAAGLTGSLLVEALESAGLPPGVVNLVCGRADVGKALAADARLAGIAFTGSHAVGMSLFRQMAAGPHMRPVIVEMGGKNPTYVTNHANLDVAATGLMRSAFGLQGQKCSACSKAYVHAAVKDAFLEKLMALTDRIKIGNPEEREVFMGPLINEAALERYNWASVEVKTKGKILCGGEHLHGGLYDRGSYVRPTIVAGLDPDHRINRDERFLPFLSILPYERLTEAMADGNRDHYGLTAGVYTEDEEELQMFLEAAEAGVLYANRASGATTGAWPGIQSFCGWKGSGVSGKGGLGPHYLTQFMREQSHTIMRG